MVKGERVKLNWGLTDGGRSVGGGVRIARSNFYDWEEPPRSAYGPSDLPRRVNYGMAERSRGHVSNAGE